MKRIAILSLVAACGGDAGSVSVEPPKPTPSSISIFGAADFRLTRDSALTPGLRVFDAKGSGISNVEVSFTATDGQVSPALIQTDASGVASVRWTPRAISSTQTLTASVVGTALRATFTAVVTTSLVGRWTGTAGSTAFDFTISSHNAEASSIRSVFGIGTWDGKQMVVNGSSNGANATLTFGIGSGVLSFSGQIQNNDTMMAGSINGLSTTSTPLTLVRR
jgi:hypothetical protein